MSVARWAEDWRDRLGIVRGDAGGLDHAFAWASFWRPARVRVLVVTGPAPTDQPGDDLVRVRLPAWAGLRDTPTGFARSVHCLGWGEPSVCTPAPADGPEDDLSWDHWDLLGACARSDATTVAPRPGDGSTAALVTARLHWKLSVLTLLRRRGIWLVHAMSAARLPKDDRRAREMARDGLRRFVWPLVEGAAEQIWVVGEDVAHALGGLPGVTRDRVLASPEELDRLGGGLGRLAGRRLP